ncbi:hypothetical protein R5R35_011346 [Gryllus longicercus]|uniref:Histone-lysine N-methyltransferase, H3 lysine-79 specific n=1 Tax=Gryllus longicercus TaxID=2509291 RepID=A0AAN9VXC8_9ORTH
MARQLSLRSPYGEEPIILQWPDSCENSEQFSDLYIVETIKWVCDDMPELKRPIKKSLLREYDTGNFESMKTLCERFNREIERLQKVRKYVSTTSNAKRRPSRGLLQHILRLTYECSVIDPKKLNQYKPFSHEVYGETSFEVISTLTEKIDITEDDVFLDLGSGIGQVVLQISASTACRRSLGIERSEIPCAYAENMDRNFRQWMKWFGKDHGEYHLIRGDFLEPQFRDYILTANIIFVNNYAFDPVMDYKLKEMLADMREGSRIVSSRSLCPENFRITERSLNDIGCIITMSEMCCFSGSVSWTNKPVPYYLHVINRTKLELYFQGLKDSKNQDSRKNDTGSHYLTHNISLKLDKKSGHERKDKVSEYNFIAKSDCKSLKHSCVLQTQLLNSGFQHQAHVENNLRKCRNKVRRQNTKRPLKLRLYSPVGAEPLVYLWPYDTPTSCEELDFVSEITETIEFVCEHFLDDTSTTKSRISDVDTCSYESMKMLCVTFNEEVAEYVKRKQSSTVKNKMNDNNSNALLVHVLGQVYNRSVSDAKKLNHYKPFSSEVYGETSHEVIFEIMNKIKLTNDDIFLDLGSGVGQVVLQVAACTPCKISIGIERAKVASSYAKSMDINFKKLMNWYGKKYGDYSLIEGDFFDKSFRKVILDASVIFVNNYAFDAVTDYKLREIFADIKEGTQIISPRSLCSLNFRINQRNLDDIGSIMNVTQISNTSNSLSWTSNPVPFYLHVIDRTMLTRFLEKWIPSKVRRKRSSV